MTKRLLSSLLLSIALMLCFHSVNAIDKSHADFWSAGHTLEERLSDIDNHDIDGGLSQTALFTAYRSSENKKSLLVKNNQKEQLTYGFIRAPPTEIL